MQTRRAQVIDLIKHENKATEFGRQGPEVKTLSLKTKHPGFQLENTMRTFKSQANQRISYVDPDSVDDPEMQAELDRCRRDGTPRPESQAIRAHVPATFWSFRNTWRDVFHNGVVDHSIKELCRVYVSKSVLCEFCGNQRSIQSANKGLVEHDYMDLINFERSDRYDDRQKSALRYTECIVWDLESTDDIRNLCVR